MQERANLILIAPPPAVKAGHARATIGDHERIARDVPKVPRRYRARAVAAAKRKVLRRRFHPVEERQPNRSRLRVLEALAHHEQLERVVWLECNLFAPVRIEEIVGVEGKEAPNQTPESVVRLRLDLSPRAAEERG